MILAMSAARSLGSWAPAPCGRGTGQAIERPGRRDGAGRRAEVRGVDHARDVLVAAVDAGDEVVGGPGDGGSDEGCHPAGPPLAGRTVAVEEGPGRRPGRVD